LRDVVAVLRERAGFMSGAVDYHSQPWLTI
jgi:hypothetical protein